jgi:hypothetical protein
MVFKSLAEYMTMIVKARVVEVFQLRMFTLWGRAKRDSDIADDLVLGLPSDGFGA